MGGVAGAQERTVFIERAVAAVVEAILNLPVAAGESEELGGGGGLRRQAGDAVTGALMGLASTVAPGAHELEDLSEVRPVGEVVEHLGGGEGASFQATMPLAAVGGAGEVGGDVAPLQQTEVG